MSPSRAATLQAGRQMLGLTLGELWIAYMRLGGNLAPDSINTYLRGGPEVADHDHDILAQALNEGFIDHDSDHPIAYADELPAHE